MTFPGRSVERKAVLIIDDDPHFRELVRLCLEGIDVDILEAEDCVHGLKQLRGACDRVAVILLDYWMPNMVPVQCAKHLCAQMRPSTRILLVTAAVDPKVRAMELGLSEWLSKPFDIARLRRIIEETALSGSSDLRST